MTYMHANSCLCTGSGETVSGGEEAGAHRGGLAGVYLQFVPYVSHSRAEGKKERMKRGKSEAAEGVVVEEKRELKVLCEPSEVVETLEDHQLQLQGIASMAMSVDCFREGIVTNCS